MSPGAFALLTAARRPATRRGGAGGPPRSRSAPCTPGWPDSADARARRCTEAVGDWSGFVSPEDKQQMQEELERVIALAEWGLLQ